MMHDGEGPASLPATSASPLHIQAQRFEPSYSDAKTVTQAYQLGKKDAEEYSSNEQQLLAIKVGNLETAKLRLEKDSSINRKRVQDLQEEKESLRSMAKKSNAERDKLREENNQMVASLTRAVQKYNDLAIEMHMTQQNESRLMRLTQELQDQAARRGAL
jgi:hypothetical protein